MTLITASYLNQQSEIGSDQTLRQPGAGLIYECLKVIFLPLRTRADERKARKKRNLNEMLVSSICTTGGILQDSTQIEEFLLSLGSLS